MLRIAAGSSLSSCRAVIALAIVVFSDPLTEHDVLRAQSIQLISADGDLLAEFGVQDGSPGLYLHDNNGVNRAALIHAAEGARLYLNDEGSLRFFDTDGEITNQVRARGVESED